eukprot:Opistho-2@58400
MVDRKTVGGANIRNGFEKLFAARTVAWWETAKTELAGSTLNTYATSLVEMTTSTGHACSAAGGGGPCAGGVGTYGTTVTDNTSFNSVSHPDGAFVHPHQVYAQTLTTATSGIEKKRVDDAEFSASEKVGFDLYKITATPRDTSAKKMSPPGWSLSTVDVKAPRLSQYRAISERSTLSSPFASAAANVVIVLLTGGASGPFFIDATMARVRVRGVVSFALSPIAPRRSLQSLLHLSDRCKRVSSPATPKVTCGSDGSSGLDFMAINEKRRSLGYIVTLLYDARYTGEVAVTPARMNVVTRRMSPIVDVTKSSSVNEWLYDWPGSSDGICTMTSPPMSCNDQSMRLITHSLCSINESPAYSAIIVPFGVPGAIISAVHVHALSGVSASGSTAHTSSKFIRGRSHAPPRLTSPTAAHVSSANAIDAEAIVPLASCRTSLKFSDWRLTGMPAARSSVASNIIALSADTASPYAV